MDRIHKCFSCQFLRCCALFENMIVTHYNGQLRCNVTYVLHIFTGGQTGKLVKLGVKGTLLKTNFKIMNFPFLQVLSLSSVTLLLKHHLTHIH